MRRSIAGFSFHGSSFARRLQLVATVGTRGRRASAASLEAPKGIIAGVLLSAALWFALIMLLF